MQFRWLITSNAVTADELRKFRENNGMSFADSKRYMEDRTEPVLQYMVVDGSWVDVPVVVQYRDK